MAVLHTGVSEIIPSSRIPITKPLFYYLWPGLPHGRGADTSSNVFGKPYALTAKPGIVCLMYILLQVLQSQNLFSRLCKLSAF